MYSRQAVERSPPARQIAVIATVKPGLGAERQQGFQRSALRQFTKVSIAHGISLNATIEAKLKH